MSLIGFKDWALAQGSVAKYNDGKYKGECVSLINQYCWRELNVPAESWGNAIDWANIKTPQGQYFDYPTDLKPGDILAYGVPYGKAIVNGKIVYLGHIEIYLGNNQSMEQNRAGDGKIHVRSILNGWSRILRRKGGYMADTIENPYVNGGDAVNAFRALIGREPTQGDIDYVTKTKRTWNKQGEYRGWFYDLLAHPELKGAVAYSKLKANRDEIEVDLKKAEETIKQLQSQLDAANAEYIPTGAGNLFLKVDKK